MMAKSEKSPMARASIAAREARMNPQPMPMPEPVVSQARHGRPDEAQLAGGMPWQPDRPVQGGQKYDQAGKPVLYPENSDGDCDQ